MVHYRRYKKYLAGDKDSSDEDEGGDEDVIGVDRFKFKASLHNREDGLKHEENKNKESDLSSNSSVEPDEIRL